VWRSTSVSFAISQMLEGSSRVSIAKMLPVLIAFDHDRPGQMAVGAAVDRAVQLDREPSVSLDGALLIVGFVSHDQKTCTESRKHESQFFFVVSWFRACLYSRPHGRSTPL
jgi:hypothetical protein